MSRLLHNDVQYRPYIFSAKRLRLVEPYKCLVMAVQRVRILGFETCRENIFLLEYRPQFRI